MAPTQTTPVKGGGGKGGNSLLTSDQLSFSRELAAQTGLSVDVIGAWVLQEGGSTTGGKFNFLNIGNTDSGARNQSSVWNTTPEAAANVTALWLQGKSKAGYTTASPGIQAILRTAVPGGTPTGQSGVAAAEAQIRAIQASGWATSGEPLIPKLYDELLQQGGAGSGAGTNGSESVPAAISDPTGVLSSPFSSITSAATALIKAVTDPQFWIRVAEIVGGFVLVTIALKTLTGVDATPSTLTSKVA